MMVEVQIEQRILVVSFSVVIVTHGREELLSKCLDSLRPGRDDWQLIIVANGGPLLEDLRAKAMALTPRFTYLESDIKLSPGKARNEALVTAEGEWIFFLDDDAYVLPGYWDKIFPLLGEPRIDVIGGPDSPASGMNSFGLALALALSSPFCTGSTFARHKPQGVKLQYTDEEKLSSCNLWVKKAALEGISFPEDFQRAEETVVLQKLKQSGKVLCYHPKLAVAHHRRRKLSEIIRPSFNAGLYRSKTMKQKLRKGNDIFWLPAVFVALHLLFFFDPVSFWYLVRMYVSIILFVSIALSMQARRASLFPMVALLHYVIVFLYGAGFISERIRRVKG